MKKQFYFLLLSATIIFSSCSKDDDGGQVNSTNTLTVDDIEVSITQAIVEDFGADGNHYNYDFTLSGNTNNTPYALYLELFSPLSAGQTFQNGSFNFVNTFDGNDDNFIFLTADLNGVDIVSGQVTVTGSNNNYTLEGSFTLSNDNAVTIDYSGEFTYINQQ